MERARLLSDLHSLGVAPFRLRATFSFVGAAPRNRRGNLHGSLGFNLPVAQRDRH
jgi:hypothetical protein